MRDGVKAGWAGMNNRELSKMWTNPIIIRVRVKGSRKITREFIVSSDLVFQSQPNGKYKLINTIDNFLHGVLSTSTQ